MGIKAVAAESVAEIFFGNCTSLGIPAVTASREDLEQMNQAVLSEPTTPMELNLEAKTIGLGDSTVPVSISEGAWEALTTGQWDFLSQLLGAGTAIDDTSKQLPYISGFNEGV